MSCRWQRMKLVSPGGDGEDGDGDDGGGGGGDGADGGGVVDSHS